MQAAKAAAEAAAAIAAAAADAAASVPVLAATAGFPEIVLVATARATATSADSPMADMTAPRAVAEISVRLCDLSGRPALGVRVTLPE